MSTPTKACARLLVGLFLLGLASPLATELLSTGPPDPPVAENRRAAERPRWQWNAGAIQAFPRAYESYFDDTFGLRFGLLRWHSLRQIGLFGVFPSASMYLGGQGFWFFADEHSIELMRGTLPFPKSELEVWAATLSAQAQWCRARGIGYVFAIGPSKEAIYPELVPAQWERLGPTRYDELVARLAGSGVPLLDLRPALAQEQRHDRPELRDFTYHPLGTHWTERGCWAACCAIERALARDCPTLVPLAREQLATALVALPGDTWAARAYVSDVYTQPYYEVRPQAGWRQTVTRETRRGQTLVLRRGADPARPRAVMFRDSFGFKVDEFLAEDCSLLVQSHLTEFDAQLVEEVQPELVIQLYVDRRLGLAPPVFAPFDEAALQRARFEAAHTTLWRLEPAPEQAVLAPGASRMLPQAELDPQRCALLRLLVDAAEAGRLELACGPASPEAGCGPRRMVLSYAAGRNELFVRLSGRDLAGTAQLCGPAPGPVALRALELRAEQP
jgi:hypothetical protein